MTDYYTKEWDGDAKRLIEQHVLPRYRAGAIKAIERSSREAGIITRDLALVLLSQIREKNQGVFY